MIKTAIIPTVQSSAFFTSCEGLSVPQWGQDFIPFSISPPQ